jgi:multiple sugar transport system substrate-binding protein
MHQDQLATNAVRKIIVPVDDVASALGLEESDFSPENWKAGIYQGKRYGIPLDVHSLAMYWREDAAESAGMSEAPTDADSYEQALQSLQKSGLEEPFWMPTRWPSHLMFLSLLWQNGGEPYAEDGSKATFDSEEGIAALTWQVDQIKKGYSPKNVAIDTQYVGFKNNPPKTAITWDGIWQINDLQTTAEDLRWSIAPIPQVGDQPAVWANSHQLVLFRSRVPDDDRLLAAKAFVKYLTEQSAAWSAAGMIPARNSAREAPEFTESPQASVAEAIPAMRFLPTLPGVPDVQAQTLEIAVSETILGLQEPEAALQGAAAQATQLLQANLRKFER